MELLWNRILEAVQMLSKTHQVEIPAGLQRATGNIWQRDRQQRNALNAFLLQSGLSAFSLDEPLHNIADEMDEAALRTMHTISPVAQEQEDEVDVEF